jgi:hypothetical protein
LVGIHEAVNVTSCGLVEKFKQQGELSWQKTQKFRMWL